MWSPEGQSQLDSAAHGQSIITILLATLGSVIGCCLLCCCTVIPLIMCVTGSSDA